MMTMTNQGEMGPCLIAGGDDAQDYSCSLGSIAPAELGPGGK